MLLAPSNSPLPVSKLLSRIPKQGRFYLFPPMPSLLSILFSLHIIGLDTHTDEYLSSFDFDHHSHYSLLDPTTYITMYLSYAIIDSRILFLVQLRVRSFLPFFYPDPPLAFSLSRPSLSTSTTRPSGTCTSFHAVQDGIPI